MKALRSSAPAHSLLNPARRYTNAASTNIAATFARIRAEQAAKQAEKPRKRKS